MKNEIVDIANTYLAEHDGELPILVVARNENDSRIIRGVFREKHAANDQTTFVAVMRLAIIIYGYTEYDFVMKPEFNHEAMQMTMNTWAVGHVDANTQTSQFFEVVDDKLVPYFDEMPIGGRIAQFLPSNAERQKELPPNVVKQIKMYVENSTYVLPQKADDLVEAMDGLEALFAQYETA